MRSRLVTFYLLLLSQTVSLIGSRMSAIAIGIWVFRTTGLTAPLLLTSFFLELPGMLGGSLAGVLVDRWNRKRVLVLADAGQAAGSLLLLLSLQSGAFALWHLYAVALLQGCFGALQGPAHSATMTLLVPDVHRDRANAIHELAFPLAGVLAPVLTGLLYALVGVTGVILVDLCTFLVGAGVAVLLTIPQPAATAEGHAARGSFFSELQGGLRFLQQRRPLLVFLLFAAWLNFLWNGPLELTIPYLISTTGSESQMGLGMGLMSLGALAGAALLSVFGSWRPRMRVMLLGLLLNGLMFLGYGLARSLPGLGLTLFVLMVPLPVNNALLRSILQLKTPPDLQGRVFAVESQLALLGSTTSFLLIGPLVDSGLRPLVSRPAWAVVAPLVGTGPGAAIGLVQVVTGLLLLASTGLVFSWPRLRRLESELPDYQGA